MIFSISFYCSSKIVAGVSLSQLNSTIFIGAILLQHPLALPVRLYILRQLLQIGKVLIAMSELKTIRVILDVYFTVCMKNKALFQPTDYFLQNEKLLLSENELCVICRITSV